MFDEACRSKRGSKSLSKLPPREIFVYENAADSHSHSSPRKCPSESGSPMSPCSKTTTPKHTNNKNVSTSTKTHNSSDPQPPKLLRGSHRDPQKFTFDSITPTTSEVVDEGRDDDVLTTADRETDVIDSKKDEEALVADDGATNWFLCGIDTSNDHQCPMGPNIGEAGDGEEEINDLLFDEDEADESDYENERPQVTEISVPTRVVVDKTETFDLVERVLADKETTDLDRVERARQKSVQALIKALDIAPSDEMDARSRRMSLLVEEEEDEEEEELNTVQEEPFAEPKTNADDDNTILAEPAPKPSSDSNFLLLNNSLGFFRLCP